MPAAATTRSARTARPPVAQRGGAPRAGRLPLPRRPDRHAEQLARSGRRHAMRPRRLHQSPVSDTGQVWGSAAWARDGVPGHLRLARDGFVRVSDTGRVGAGPVSCGRYAGPDARLVAAGPARPTAAAAGVRRAARRRSEDARRPVGAGARGHRPRRDRRVLSTSTAATCSTTGLRRPHLAVWAFFAGGIYGAFASGCSARCSTAAQSARLAGRPTAARGTSSLRRGPVALSLVSGRSSSRFTATTSSAAAAATPAPVRRSSPR